MNPTPGREEGLFQAAVQLSGAARATFLDGACHGDPALRQRLETLLAAHEVGDSFLEPQDQASPSQPLKTIKLQIEDEPDEAVGQTLGRYKLLEKIGEGGYGGASGPLKVWEATAKLKPLWEDKSGAPAGAVAFSPDGKTVAAARQYNGIALFDAETGAQKHFFAPIIGNSPYLTMAFSPDGKSLATGDSGGNVNLHDPETGRLLMALKGHTSRVNSLAFSADGRTLATGNEDRTVRLWDAVTGQERCTFKGFESVIKAVAFSPDGDTLAGGCWDGTVRFWRSLREEAAIAYAQPSEESVQRTR